MKIPPMRFPKFRLPVFGRSLLVAGGCVAMLTTLRGEVLLDETFEDTGDIEKVAVISSKTTWESSGNRTILGIVSDPDGLKSGNVLSIGNNLVFARIPDTDLEVGSALVLSLNFRSPDADVQYPAPLRIGLCNSTDDAPDKGETMGYWVSTGPGGERKTSVSLERNEDSLIGGGNDGASIGEVFQLGYDWTKTHRLTFKIARPSAGVIELHVQLDDEAAVVRTDAQESLIHFNLVALRLANTPQSILLVDDIKLELVKVSKP